MTKPETICECEHASKIHIRKNYQYGAKGCLHEYTDGNICSCEKFIKERKN